MRAIASIAFGSGALGLALMAGTALCSAQTSVTRQITSEPVETTIAQGPEGTIVTRRPLDPTPDPGAPAFVRGPIQYPSAAAVTVGQAASQDTIAAPAPTVTTARRAATRRVVTRAHARTERPITSGQGSRPVVRTVTQPAPDQTLVLTPAQRQTVYRTIVQRQVYPPPVVVAPPVVAETEVVAPPPPVVGYPLRTIYPAGDDYADAGYRDGAYRDQDYGYRDQPYRDDRYRYPYHWDGVALVPGARLPASIPLSAVPASVVANVPTLAPYSYAYVDDRVYLVDPGSGIIVAELTR
jgi:hypothetical protein